MRAGDSPQWWEPAVISQQIKPMVNTSIQTMWSSSGCNISMNSEDQVQKRGGNCKDKAEKKLLLG